MKKNYRLLLAVICISILAGMACFAKGFSKTQEYTDGLFTDVKSTSWYAKDVASAYELGFMSGKGNGVFAPDGNVTVAEAITMASRIHSIYNGKTIEKTDGKWYDMYVKYATGNGIIEESQFENFDRNIMRYEMAILLASSMPEEWFSKINNVKKIPDVNESEDYNEKLLLLYNSGIVMGSTEYGDFLATNPIKRSETSAIINRVALPENRLSKTLKEYESRIPAVYLIDNSSMTRTVRGKTALASGWKYENTFDSAVNAFDKSSNVLTDNSEEASAFLHRDITVVNEGTVVLETVYKADKAGYDIVLCDADGKNMFTVRSSSDGSFFAVGEKEEKLSLDFSGEAVYLKIIMNLDDRTAKIVADGKNLGTFGMSKTASDISRLTFATGKKEKCILSVDEVYMYCGYAVNDEFILDFAGEKPYGWETEGDVLVVKNVSDLDTNSVSLSGKAKKNFEKVSGKFVYETYVKVPENSKLFLSLKCGETSAVIVDAQNGIFTSGGKQVRSFNPDIWQLVRIEADTDKKNAIIKINNKKCLDVKFDAEYVDGIEISGEGKCLFDDVKLYSVYDYADYCPAPVPVTDDGVYVGMSICSLWREGSHYGWDNISPFEEITPVLGYYDEGLSEVADWEIKFMTEHGYDFQHFCWYVGNAADGIKKPRLSSALHDGYMNAKYSNLQDFMIMWENNAYNYTTLEDFKAKVWNYWCDWYFTDDRYLVIDNKPLVTIFSISHFIEDMGGKENAKQAVRFMKEDIKRYGFDGINVLFCDDGSRKDVVETMKYLGGDAYVCYGFGENSHSAAFQKQSMNTAFSNGEPYLLPSVGVGFNDIAWTETRTPMATPEAHGEVLLWAKNDYMPRLSEKTKEDWKSKFVLATTWNEYGEGHYIMPSGLNGFGYVDANRSVFSSAAGKDDKAHFDIVPTKNQKKRLSYLYPSRTQPIRRTYLIDDKKGDLQSLDVIKGWNFENISDAQMWNAFMNTQNLGYSQEEKALVGVSTSTDPAITLIRSVDNHIKADEVKYLKVRMKYDADVVSTFSLFFITDKDEDYSGQRRLYLSTDDQDGYNDYYIDVSENRYWLGTITALRFDPMECEGNFYIKSIEFLGEKNDENICVINVDGTEIKADGEFTKYSGKDVLFGANPTNGFFALHNFYYEWNRSSGVLLLKTGTGHTLEFTVGKDTALVDGKQKKLTENFFTVDGLVMLPLKFIYDNAEIEYTEKDGDFEVKIRDKDVYEEINERVENHFEFNVDNDAEGWKTGASQGGVSGGLYTFTATPVSYSTGFDPMLENGSVTINAALYKGVEIKVRPTFNDSANADTLAVVYFTTSNDPNYNEAKTSKVDISTLTPSRDGYYTVYFDLSSNEKWNGNVMSIRFDPSNSGGVFEVDYIRMIMNPEAAEEYNKAEQKAKERQKNLLAADEGKPFYMENADAEDTSVEPLTRGGYVALVISEDELIPGNHAFEYIPVKDKESNSYTMVPTRFKPGVTYLVEFDFRLTTDHMGDPIDKAGIGWNLRYTDLVDGAMKTLADHHGYLGTFSSADGWQRVSFTSTITTTTTIRDNDYFSLYAGAVKGPDGEFRNVGYMIDNIVVTVVE